MGVPTDQMATSLAAFGQGVDQADADERGETTDQQVTRIREEAMVKSLFEKIDKAREHDKEAYAQLARDRMYARGDSIFTTAVNIIGSYIDTWVSLLYAKDPDVDSTPSETVGKSDMEEARLFGKTGSIIVRKLWRKARLKTHARAWIRASLTSHMGWLKVTWQEREGSDPITDQAISDLQDNLADVHRRVHELKEQEYDCGPEELQAEQIRLAIKGLEEKREVVKRKGLCMDQVDMADITVSDEAPSVSRYLDSPWISHRLYMRVSEAAATFPALDSDELKSCATFSQKPPKAAVQREAGALAELSRHDADAYVAENAIQNSGKGGFLCVEEFWDKTTNQVFTIIRGLKRYARAPYAPNPGTTRFYPFFGLHFTDVDGNRWPQSLNQRSQSIQDAFNRTFDAFEKHRKRVKPKLAVNAAAIDSEQLTKILNADIQEIVAIHALNPKADLRQLIAPILYAAIDPALYDTSPLMKQFELIWGLQEAMTATIDVAKTATESELQQTGTNARKDDKRDRFEEELNDVSQYTLEISLQKINPEEAAQMAGPEAFWPSQDEMGLPIDIEDVDMLAQLNIRAGSSGKPNSRAMRESWAAIMPLIQALMEKIAMLRQSNPLELADKLEELIVETAARAGEALDPTRFIPQLGQPQPMLTADGQVVPGFPGQAPTPGGPAPVPGGVAPPELAPASNGDPAPSETPTPPEGQ